MRDKMHRISKHISETTRLADRLLEDIRYRNLQPGDSYFTTRDARQFLGVGGTAANRALQLLEKRQVIRRIQRRGAVVLPAAKSHSTEIARIHIVVPELFYRREGFANDGILFGIQSEFPLATVSHCLLSGDNDVERIKHLVDQTMSTGGIDAFVLASVPFEIQRAVSRTDFPAVVFGTAYQGIGDLPQLERDQQDAVAKVVCHLRNRGAKRIVALMRQFIMPGDQQTFEAILSLLGPSVLMRFLAPDHEHTVAMAQNILRQEPSVDAFLCQTQNQALAVMEAIQGSGRSFDEIGIGALLSFGRRNEPPKFPHIRMVSTPEEIGRKLASMLRERHDGRFPKNELIPVELVDV